MSILELIKKGAKNPTKIPPFINNRMQEGKLEMKYGLYRQRHNIPLQQKRVNQLLENEEFVLIILDSCRFDHFEQEYQKYIDGDLELIWSAGNRTPKWTPNLWSGQYDIDYIAGVSFPVSKYAYEGREGDFDPDDTFSETIHLSYRDELLSTIPPDILTDVALHHLSQCARKRCVIHYGQPHRPYIGDKKILPWRVKTKALQRVIEQHNIDDKYLPPTANTEYVMGETLLQLGIPKDVVEQIPKERYSVRQRIRDGHLTDEELRVAYRDNLRCVLEQVQKLITYIDCPVVVSSDHGEHLGEFKDELSRYNHPDETHPVLREVPWFVVNDTSKGKNSLSELDFDVDKLIQYTADSSEGTVHDHLEALGYVQ